MLIRLYKENLRLIMLVEMAPDWLFLGVQAASGDDVFFEIFLNCHYRRFSSLVPIVGKHIRVHRRSAGLQPAVSPIFNRQPARMPVTNALAIPCERHWHYGW